MTGKCKTCGHECDCIGQKRSDGEKKAYCCNCWYNECLGKGYIDSFKFCIKCPDNRMTMTANVPKIVGYIIIGSTEDGGTALQLSQGKKPNRFHRFFLRLVFGIRWVDG
jgi:hypothetical protein